MPSAPPGRTGSVRAAAGIAMKSAGLPGHETAAEPARRRRRRARRRGAEGLVERDRLRRRRMAPAVRATRAPRASPRARCPATGRRAPRARRCRTPIVTPASSSDRSRNARSLRPLAPRGARLVDVACGGGSAGSRRRCAPRASRGRSRRVGELDVLDRAPSGRAPGQPAPARRCADRSAASPIAWICGTIPASAARRASAARWAGRGHRDAPLVGRALVRLEQQRRPRSERAVGEQLQPAHPRRGRFRPRPAASRSAGRGRSAVARAGSRIEQWTRSGSSPRSASATIAPKPPASVGVGRAGRPGRGRRSMPSASRPAAYARDRPLQVVAAGAGQALDDAAAPRFPGGLRRATPSASRRSAPPGGSAADASMPSSVSTRSLTQSAW